ncbi:hypothetical protein L8U04_06900 [Campylobacter sp. IFREMER_LSEM_CL908]|uniref:hypothetical protein n=1 Tax=Campylobacter sp. IFREMER_LSEM_CL908 TaxID=2911624 RepID=UPI0021E94F95|nr:hypothetical protein [Campylobacter sp. IFREMER_LSEM_CL908]MCV3394267.1 hypothetical protein [Campylobacter sp. IFREMER_LSEM_CL908]
MTIATPASLTVTAAEAKDAKDATPKAEANILCLEIFFNITIPYIFIREFKFSYIFNTKKYKKIQKEVFKIF